jgi:hypothetical protein
MYTNLLDPDTAIEFFRRQLVKDIERLPYDDPQVYKWWNTTENIIRKAFGENHPNVGDFTTSCSSAQNRQERQQEHVADIRQRKGLVEGFIEQLEMMRPKNLGVSVSVEREGIYFAGQQFDAMLRVSQILSAARSTITIIDGYIGEEVLALLTTKASSVTAFILTKPLPPALAVIAKAFNSQHGRLSIRSSQAFHDRFVIIDDRDFYHFGASIKDLGKRGFMFSRIEETEMIEALRKKFSQEWASATVEV